MTLAETILSDERLVLALATMMTAVVIALRSVGPRRALLGDAVRGVAWRLLDPVASKRGRPLLADKTDADDEHIATVDVAELTLARALWAEGYRWNPISTKKYRDRGGRQWSILSSVYRDSVADGDQHHVYVFRNGDGTLDVYGHHEPSVTDPDDHVGGEEQVAGDPEDRFDDVRAALD